MLLNKPLLSGGETPGLDLNDYWFNLFNTPDLAFSMRKLNPAATDCLSICDAAGGNIQLIGFDGNKVDIAAINAWRATHGNAYCYAFWNQNLTETIRCLATTNAARRPLIDPTTYSQNGLPELYFDGVDDVILFRATPTGSSIGIGIDNGNWLHFVSHRIRNLTSWGIVVSGIVTQSGHASRCLGTNSNAGEPFIATKQGSSAFSRSASSGNSLNVEGFQQHAFLKTSTDASNIFIQHNGVDIDMETTSVNVSDTVVGIGRYRGTIYSAGNLVEYIAYLTTQEAGDRADMNAHINNAMGMTA